MTDLETMDEKQKMLLSQIRDSYVAIRKQYGFTSSIYLVIESLIELDGKLFKMYGDFNEKERPQIIRAFTTWALEQEDDE
ncbi:hypothetical protein HB825_05485 [Listeria booriae]|uniref:hypothetical protein n=1 Tax=Listeria booriae TaxID=1552123 RepID=UPI00164E4A1B|nr:hypothetical protein [Listeria booriae]MBC6134289.1 hypothetical protein [Listeria booriae]